MTRNRPLDPRQRVLALDENERTATPAGSLQWDGELRAALAQAIKDSGIKREEIAARMEEALGADPNYPISVSQLDAWTAPSRTDWRFPLVYLPAFIQVTGATWLLARVASKCGHKVVAGTDALHAELAELIGQEEDLKARKSIIRKALRSGRR